MSRRLWAAVVPLAALLVVAGVVAWFSRSCEHPPVVAPTDSSAASVAGRQELPGGVILLLPGWGGDVAGLRPTAAALSSPQRRAQVVEPAGRNLGDLADSAKLLDETIMRVVGQGAASVDLVGFSAGGLVLREWARSHPDHVGLVRRVVTLGTPHHGTKLSSTALIFGPEQCQLACRQMDPASQFLSTLNATAQLSQQRKLSLITVDDQVVYPWQSSLWPQQGASTAPLNLRLQEVCPGVQIAHHQLPTHPLVVGLMRRELLGAGLTQAPASDQCAALTSEGSQALAGQ